MSQWLTIGVSWLFPQLGSWLLQGNNPASAWWGTQCILDIYRVLSPAPGQFLCVGFRGAELPCPREAPPPCCSPAAVCHATPRHVTCATYVTCVTYVICVTCVTCVTCILYMTEGLLFPSSCAGTLLAAGAAKDGSFHPQGPQLQGLPALQWLRGT